MQNILPDCQLCLEDLKYEVYLGWSEEERQQKQQILVNLIICYPQMPITCMSDKLAEESCYATLHENIKNFLQDKSFRLIEYLTYQLYSYIKNLLPGNYQISVRVKKFPALDDGSQTASFICSDWK